MNSAPRPSIFSKKDSNIIIEIFLTEDELLHLIDLARDSCNLYLYMHESLKSKGKPEEAERMLNKAQEAKLTMQRLIEDGNPDLPTSDTPIM